MTHPRFCPGCQDELHTPAEAFLHEQVHATPGGAPNGLGKLPFVLMPAVARVMDEYAARYELDEVGRMDERNFGSDQAADALRKIANTGEHRGVFGGEKMEAAAQAILKLRRAAEAAEGILGLAYLYAAGGGRLGPEMREYRAAEEIIKEALGRPPDVEGD